MEAIQVDVGEAFSYLLPSVKMIDLLKWLDVEAELQAVDLDDVPVTSIVVERGWEGFRHG